MQKKIIQNVLDTNYRLAGISTDAPGHRLCWAMDKALQFDFQRIEDLVWTEKGLHYRTAVYAWQDVVHRYGVTLVQNREMGKALVREAQNVDYLLVVRLMAESEFDQLIQELRKIEIIRAVFVLDAGALRKPELLSFDDDEQF